MILFSCFFSQKINLGSGEPMENKTKKTKLIVIIAVLIITNMITFTVAITSNMLLGNKLIVTVDSSETAAGIKKLLVLKEQIASEYYLSLIHI